VTQASEQQGYPIGCTLDVMPEMESYCSGRRRCDVKIDDVAFPRPTSCNRALKVHLWVDYRCIKGMSTRPFDVCFANSWSLYTF